MPQLIRLATLTDVDALVRLMRQSYDERRKTLVEALVSRSLETLLEDSRLGQIWMIEHDGHAAGFVIMTVSFSMEHVGLRGFIDEFYVAPQYRRRGLGNAALEEVKRACLRRGVRALLVETGEGEEAALSAYRRSGFVDAGRCLLALPLTES